MTTKCQQRIQVCCISLLACDDYLNFCKLNMVILKDCIKNLKIAMSQVSSPNMYVHICLSMHQVFQVILTCGNWLDESLEFKIFLARLLEVICHFCILGAKRERDWLRNNVAGFAPKTGIELSFPVFSPLFLATKLNWLSATNWIADFCLWQFC